ncbi:MAG: 30S ribosomal protein S18 [bacterium]|nr:30S ribosomal protein S18 [bacterium]PIU01718.1 MAG: 30S ribosomal protein S18 [bacterium (Candidatus Torokbacteria) CG09_land_8_20_14_0_10_42_11]
MQPKKYCRFCVDPKKIIDYKKVELIQRCLSSYGKIRPKKRTGTCSFHQRQLNRAIKNARFMALLPYTIR